MFYIMLYANAVYFKGSFVLFMQYVHAISLFILYITQHGCTKYYLMAGVLTIYILLFHLLSIYLVILLSRAGLSALQSFHTLTIRTRGYAWRRWCSESTVNLSIFSILSLASHICSYFMLTRFQQGGNTCMFLFSGKF